MLGIVIIVVAIVFYGQLTEVSSMKKAYRWLALFLYVVSALGWWGIELFFALEKYIHYGVLIMMHFTIIPGVVLLFVYRSIKKTKDKKSVPNHRDLDL